MVKTWRFAPKDLIIRENDPGESAYYIESGKVEITKESNGKNVHIAFLAAGSTFGEMSMVDELPRSATVTAVEETVVSEFHRDDLYTAMKENPAVFGGFLKSIFERLREANKAIAARNPDANPNPVLAPIGTPPVKAGAQLGNLKEPGSRSDVYCLEALTPRAAESVPVNPVPITCFPFKIGRKSSDPFLYNNLEIQDLDPAQISRHHVSIVMDAAGRVGVLDRGSELGAVVDGTRIGGKHGPGPVYFEGKEGILILGSDDSPYQYRLGYSRG